MNSASAKPRIWEIDALRGFLILCVVVVHTVYAVQELLTPFVLPKGLYYLFHYGGAAFVVLSGLSATLGSRSFFRGILVFACGMVLTLGSILTCRWGILSDKMVIRFGVLHLLGLAMMLYPLLKKLPSPLLLALALATIVLGAWFTTRTVDATFLYPLGLCYSGFSSGDYFPIFPQLGWFMLGIVLGRRFYAQRQTRFPRINAQRLPFRFLRFCGRHSLWIYLLHLPVVGLVVLAIAAIIGSL